MAHSYSSSMIKTKTKLQNCPECYFSISTVGLLRRHFEKEHNAIISFQCSSCAAYFASWIFSVDGAKVLYHHFSGSEMRGWAKLFSGEGLVRLPNESKKKPIIQILPFLRRLRCESECDISPRIDLALLSTKGSKSF